MYLDSPFFDDARYGSFQTTQYPNWVALDQYGELNRQSLNLGDTLVRLISTDVRIVPSEVWDALFVPPLFSPDFLESMSGMTRWDPNADPYITSITAENLETAGVGYNGDVLVGYFKPLLEEFDGPYFEGEIYFMITNGLHDPNALASETVQRITIDFDFADSGIDSLQRRSRLTGEVEPVALESLGGSLYRLELELEGGTGDLFKYNTDAPLIPATPDPNNIRWRLLPDGDWHTCGAGAALPLVAIAMTICGISARHKRVRKRMRSRSLTRGRQTLDARLGRVAWVFGTWATPPLDPSWVRAEFVGKNGAPELDP